MVEDVGLDALVDGPAGVGGEAVDLQRQPGLGRLQLPDQQGELLVDA